MSNLISDSIILSSMLISTTYAYINIFQAYDKRWIYKKEFYKIHYLIMGLSTIGISYTFFQVIKFLNKV